MSAAKTVAKRAAPGLDREAGLRLLAQMVRIRVFEEKCAELYAASKIRGFLHLGVGQEAIAAGVLDALGPEDAVVATYREHGHALARGIPARSLMAEMFGKVDGVSRGRGGSMHIFHAPARFYGGYAIVGGGLPPALGLALGAKMRGERSVTACFFGDGAAAEGVFHESLNLAQLWKLPVLFCCENNLYAMGTALDRSQAQVDIAAKAATHGMPAAAVDGMDAIAVRAAAMDAARAVREGDAPRFLELRTYRFRAHSMFDPERYRDKAEVQRWKKRDPIPALADRLGLEPEMGRLEREATAEVEDAVAFAEASPWEPVEDLGRFVLSEQRG